MVPYSCFIPTFSLSLVYRDERAKVPDPAATKPDDWDEDAPRMIEDLEAKKPEGWLDDEALEVCHMIPQPSRELHNSFACRNFRTLAHLHNLLICP